MADYLGDFDTGKTVVIGFTTHDGNGGAVAPSSGFEAADVKLYKDGGTTERASTSGWTMTSPFDSITGLHVLSIDLSDNTDAGFYASGHDYMLVLNPDTETVNSQTVVRVLGYFSIQNRSALRPATAGRTLVVDAAGLADANVVKLGPSGSGTAQTARDIGASVLLSSGAGTGQLDFTSGVVKANVTQFGGSNGTFASGRPEVNTTHIAGTAQTAADLYTKLRKFVQLLARKDAAIATDNATELTAINADGGSGAGAFDNTTDSEEAIADSGGGGPTAADIADAVWEEAIADHSGTVGSTAEALAAAGSAGDPWNTALPGAYASGKAGYILGTNLDAQASAIKAKTDNLPATPAATGDAMTLTSGERNSVADALLDRANGVETGFTPRQSFRLMLAALAGKLSGAGSSTVKIRDVGDSKDRITATVDANGNRTAVTRDVS